jgi:geranylgeranyl diphosphate synthase, type III
VDDSDLRDGKPPSHKVFGIPATLMCCEYVLFKLFLKAVEIVGIENLIECFVVPGMKNYMGQGLELLWSDHSDQFTVQDHVIMNKAKGDYFEILYKPIQVLSDNKNDYRRIMGLAGK